MITDRIQRAAVSFPGLPPYYYICYVMPLQLMSKSGHASPPETYISTVLRDDTPPTVMS